MNHTPEFTSSLDGEPVGPMLGLATTEYLLRELICRLGSPMCGTPIEVGWYKAIERVRILAELLGGLDATEREYWTAAPESVRSRCSPSAPGQDVAS
jgi:hypothetical protein